MKKQSPLSYILPLAICILVIAAALTVPSIIINSIASKQLNTVGNVPYELYSNSESSMSSLISHRLTESERILLISGVWDSNNISPVDDSAAKSLAAIALAKKSLSELYDAGFYPYPVKSSDMYTWTCDQYSRVDTTFRTFTANYWLIKLTYFDNTLSHTILMSEDGTILYAEYNGPSSGEFLSEFATDFAALPVTGNSVSSYAPLPLDTKLSGYDEVTFPDEFTEIGVITIGSPILNDINVLNDFYANNTTNCSYYYVFRSSKYSKEQQKMHYIYGLYPYSGNASGYGHFD